MSSGENTLGYSNPFRAILEEGNQPLYVQMYQNDQNRGLVLQ